jgi:hypothetical protein
VEALHPGEHQVKLFAIEWLFQEIHRSTPHRFDGIFDTALGGENNHRQVGLALENPVENIEPIFRSEIQIEQNRIELAFLQFRESQLPGTGGFRIMALTVNEQASCVPECLVVVDDHEVHREYQ